MNHAPDTGPPVPPMPDPDACDEMGLRDDGSVDWGPQLLWLGYQVRQQLIDTRSSGADMATPVAEEGGDTIFAIDRAVEPVIEAFIEHVLPPSQRLVLVMEGLGPTGVRTFGPPDASEAFRLIIDPIDGTRNIMYDKRSAWFLAAIAEDRGEATRLSHSFASVIVELPTAKQGLCDAFLAVRGEPTRGERVGPSSTLLDFRPSRATTLRHGFGQVANFFPGTKVLAAELMERIAEANLGTIQPGTATVFDDQYISTGGQLVELMVGHDRFCCDLRPLLYRIVSGQKNGDTAAGLECHPYDMAGMLAAQQAGVILTDGFGRPLDAPMDVHSPVHWCGYANETLRQNIEPVIHAFWREHGVL